MAIFSEKGMTPIKYIKKNGIKKTIRTLFVAKPYLVLKYLIIIIFKNTRPKNIIVIESHNDFDCNGGALYNYLIKNEYNKKHKIVWLLKHPEISPTELPKNVICVPLFGQSLKRYYYLCRARIITNDDIFPEKLNPSQKMYYLTHGGCTFKNVKGLLIVPDYIDYILTSSEAYYKYECDNYSIPYPNNKMICLGYPSNDYLFQNNKNEILKITDNAYKKVVLWMPTFRKLNWGRIDGIKKQPLDIPLIEFQNDYEELNNFLKDQGVLLIIKIHPYQDMTNFNLESLSNIVVLTNETVKKLDIDNYRLMASSDALISDYSSSAYSYILLNRPIAFLLSDLEDYKLGFSVENYEKVLPGNHIYNLQQFKEFINDVIQGNDHYKSEREELCNWLYKYKDGNSCKRLVEFMNL